MGVWNSVKTMRLLSTLAATVLALLVIGCQDDKPPGVPDVPKQGHVDPRDACATPNAGCSCKEAHRVVECGQVQRRSGGQTWCSIGHRTCGEDGLWGDCEIEGLKVLETASGGPRAQSLGTAQACDNNPCDPFCQQIVDSGGDLDLPPGLQETASGGITLKGKASDGDTTCTEVEAVPATQTLTVTGLPAGASGNGLRGEYFTGTFDDGIPADAVADVIRTDGPIDFAWVDAPADGVPEDGFSVRWTGWIRPSVTQAYQLCTVSDDGVRLWLGNGAEPVIDNWTEHEPTTDCTTSPGPVLTAGTLYKVRLELFERWGGAIAQLSWRHAGAPGGEVIPAANLMPPDGNELGAGIVVAPPAAEVALHGLPAGCFAGPIEAAWNVDRPERARIDETGRVTLLSAVAGDITATGHVGELSASATVTVRVEVKDERSAPSGAVAAFAAAPSGTDPMEVLYPYADTVFPLGLRAPTIQWDRRGVAGDAVKLSLRFPATGPATFSWSKVLREPDTGRYTIPQEVWSSFEASAKGQAAVYSVQRVTRGRARPAVTRPISFASAPLPGKIYYTQYGRDDDSTLAMVADPGSATSALPVFDGDAGGTVMRRRCPACHSVSADGTLFATVDRRYSANGGLSKIDSSGAFTRLTDYSRTLSPYRDGADDFRGFAWAALTPDGKYALAANNFWGNTFERVVGVDVATRSVSLPGGFLSGGSGTGLLAKYYANTTLSGPDYRRTDPKVDFDWGTASPGGAVPATFSAAWSGEVQAYTSEPYTFAVTSSGGFRLSVGGTLLLDEPSNAALQTFTQTTPLVRGQRTPIELEFIDNGPGPNSLRLSWSTPTIPQELVPQTQLYPNDGWHGLLATYYAQPNFTAPFITERLESNLDADFGAGGPRPGVVEDDWSAIYRGQLQAPARGDLSICASSTDEVTVLVGGITRIDESGPYDGCSAPFAVTEGARYDLEVRFREATGDAALSLSWQLPGAVPVREIVPSERLTPPAGWTVPTHGLTATYYDTEDFNRSLPTGATTRATRRIEANADLTWGEYRPEFSSALTENDTFSSRLTGQLDAPCDGVYEFEVAGSQGGRLWLDGVRVSHLWSEGTQLGAQWLAQGRHDLKLDHRAGGGAAYVNLRWKPPCGGATSFSAIPTENLFPDGDRGLAGYVLAGGDNGNDHGYFIWQTPTTPGNALDVTDTSPGRWGLGASVMMVPSFAPDGSKLVFVDGDSAGGNGWRKGLSTFAFDRAARVFKDRKTVVSTWPLGDTLKWPAFESDSRSVIYQATVPADACCRTDGLSKYGYMGPSNYFEDPGRLFSVDTAAAEPVPVELARLNSGERPLDRNKAYQATVAPQVAGGYRWAVFASTRPYGNTLNLEGQQDFSNTAAYTPISDYANLQSMLWIAAIDDAPSSTTDRSHPAFFLPTQNFSTSAASGYSNERAYWVGEACREPGSGPESACEVDEDCCGAATGAAVCRVDAPGQAPLTRHCFRIPTGGDCADLGEACSASSQCCDGSACIDGSCVTPPPFSTYEPANFERIYTSNCGAGQKVDWTFFDYKARVPGPDAAIEFYAESSDDPEAFQSLPRYPATVDLPGVTRLGVQEPPGDLNDWTRITLDQPLVAAGIVERKYLKITMRLVPNSAQVAAPLLTEWRQSFSCPPGE